MILTQAMLPTILALALIGGAAEPPIPDLSGTWELDAAISDDAESQILKGAGEDSTHGIRHLERRRQLDRLVSLARASDVIEIEQTDRDFQIADRAGNLRIYYLDGRKHPRQTPWGASLDATAAWREGSLVVETSSGDVGEIREIYGLEGRQLVFLVRIRNPLFEDEIVVRHYYNRASQ